MYVPDNSCCGQLIALTDTQESEGDVMVACGVGLWLGWSKIALCARSAKKKIMIVRRTDKVK